MQIPTSRLDAVLAVFGAAVLTVQRATVDTVAGEPFLHTIRDVADVIMKVGGASAIVAAVFFWIIKKLLRPTIEKAIRSWFTEDIRRFRKALRSVQDCAEEISRHASNVQQTDDDILLVLEAVEDTRQWMEEFSEVVDRVLGIERREIPDRRDFSRTLANIAERRMSPGRRETDRERGERISRLEARRRDRERLSTVEGAEEIQRVEDPTRAIRDVLHEEEEGS